MSASFAIITSSEMESRINTNSFQKIQTLQFKTRKFSPNTL